MATDRETQLLLEAMEQGIISSIELANFMAQVTQESHGLTSLEESFRYTKNIWQIPVHSVAKEHPLDGELARKEALDRHPEKLAELMYGGRMGNDRPGDGYKYRGRGYIQLTGKDNYRSAGEALGLDLVDNPDLAASPDVAAKVAIYFWSANVHGKAAAEDVVAATQIINKASLGLEAREEYFDQWKTALTPQVMTALSKGDVLLSAGPVMESRSQHAQLHNGLHQGEQRHAVELLQQQLRDLGYTDNRGQSLQPDGYFGRSTEAAVRAFQSDHGLQSDGVAGPLTRKALNDQRQSLHRIPALTSELDGCSIRGVIDPKVPSISDEREQALQIAPVKTSLAQGITSHSSIHDMFEAMCQAASDKDMNALCIVGKAYENSPAGQALLMQGAELNQQQVQAQALAEKQARAHAHPMQQHVGRCM